MRNVGDKYSDEWGKKVAHGQLQSFDTLSVDWRDKNVLELGCNWGYLLRLLCKERSIASAIGVDATPHWKIYEQVNGMSPIVGLENCGLLEGDLLTLPELQNKRFDIIVSAGTLFVLPIDYLEKIVDWFFHHLAPNGIVVVRTRTFLSYIGGDYHNIAPDVPYAHLLFPKAEFDRYTAAKKKPLRSQNVPFTAATYIMLFQFLGFELLQVIRHKNRHSDFLISHPAVFAHYDREELNTGEVTILARRRAEPTDLELHWIDGADDK